MTDDFELVLERKAQPNETPAAVTGGGTVLMMTPPIDEDYWLYRVKVSDAQAVVGFPKFGTVGVGFAVEDDWNTNLPYDNQAEDVYRHIARNKGDDAIPADRCIEAIRMVQAAAREDRDD